MFRKIILVAIIFTLLLCIVGCGNPEVNKFRLDLKQIAKNTELPTCYDPNSGKLMGSIHDLNVKTYYDTSTGEVYAIVTAYIQESWGQGSYRDIELFWNGGNGIKPKMLEESEKFYWALK